MPLDTSRQTGPVLFGSETFRAGLISVLTAGSIVLGGNLYTDSSQNSTPDIYYNSGAYLTYTENICAGTGARQTYDHCRINNPYTGTGIIQRIHYEPEGPMPGAIICQTTQTTTSTTTGTNITNFLYHTTASGVVIVNSTGGFVASPSGAVRCWGTTNPGATRKAKLKIWWSEFMVP